MASPPHRLLTRALLAAALLLWACSDARESPREMFRVPLDEAGAVIDRTATFDPDVSADGRGSYRIEAQGTRSVRLVEIALPEIDDATLFFAAKIRSENLQGQAYLEMWCVFPGLGEFFSRDLANPVTGRTDWSFRQTPFYLRKGDRPASVKLNLVVAGQGVVWIDDLRLLAGPLPSQ